MDILGFIATPLGIVFTTVLLAAVFVMVRSVTASTRQQRRVYETLLEAAKRRSLLRITGIVLLRRKAESLRPLFAHLASHGYPKLTVTVVVYQTAGSKAASELRRMAKEYGIAVTVVTYKKGMNVHAGQPAQNKADAYMIIDEDDRFTPRFFEYASFAFTQKDIAALRVRTVLQPAVTLDSAFHAVITIFKELYSGAFSKPAVVNGDGSFIIRTKAASRGVEPVADQMLYDSFGRVRTATPYTAGWQSALALLGSVAAVVGLTMTSQADVLAYISLLIAAVMLVIAAVVIVQYHGLGAFHKFQLMLLVPLTPFLWCLAVLRFVGIQAASFVSRFVKRQAAQIALRARRVRTQE